MIEVKLENAFYVSRYSVYILINGTCQLIAFIPLPPKKGIPFTLFKYVVIPSLLSLYLLLLIEYLPQISE